jgi:hypothetical protein
MDANYNGLPTSAGATGRMLDATMATILTISMANVSGTSLAVAATTSATTRRVSPSVRTRALSPDAYMASTPIICMMSAALIRATKCANYNKKCKQQQKVQTTTKETQLQ